MIVWINEKTVFCFEKIRKTIDLSLTTNFKICSFQKNLQQLTSENFNFFRWKIARSEKMKTKKQWTNDKKNNSDLKKMFKMLKKKNWKNSEIKKKWKKKRKKNFFNDEWKKNSNIFRIFQTTIDESNEKYRFFKKNNLNVLKTWTRINHELKIYTTYKRKNKKIRFVNLKMSNDFFFEKSVNWKKKLWKMKKRDIHTIQSINIKNIWFFNFSKWSETRVWRRNVYDKFA